VPAAELAEKIDRLKRDQVVIRRTGQRTDDGCTTVMNAALLLSPSRGWQDLDIAFSPALIDELTKLCAEAFNPF